MDRHHRYSHTELMFVLDFLLMLCKNYINDVLANALYLLLSYLEVVRSHMESCAKTMSFSTRVIGLKLTFISVPYSSRHNINSDFAIKHCLINSFNSFMFFSNAWCHH